MIPMPRGNQYCNVRLDRINQILRPNAKVPIARKFADAVGLDGEELVIPAGQSNVIFPCLAEDAAIGDGVSLKVENWTENCTPNNY
jgi:hypothetical protein